MAGAPVTVPYTLAESEGGVDWKCQNCPSSGTRETWLSAAEYAEFHNTIHHQKKDKK